MFNEPVMDTPAGSAPVSYACLTCRPSQCSDCGYQDRRTSSCRQH